MILQTAIEHFRRKKATATTHATLKATVEWLSLLQSLDSKSMDTPTIVSIENKLEVLFQNPNLERKPRRVLSKFQNFLRREFSFVSKGYYQGIGIALGIALGMSLGMSLLIPFGVEIPMGMTYGMIFGLIVGTVAGYLKDKEAEKSGKII